MKEIKCNKCNKVLLKGEGFKIKNSPSSNFYIKCICGNTIKIKSEKDDEIGITFET